MRKSSLVLVFLAAFAVFGGSAAAQIGTVGPCFGDDGFNVGCCNAPQPNLPAFPPINSASLYACLHNCSLQAQFNNMLSISAPFFVACDLAVLNISVATPGPLGPNFMGVLLGKYDRTWLEILNTGGFRQVWRFLVNGDLNYTVSTTAGAIPCPVPPCTVGVAGAITPVHFTGFIDYAFDCPSAGTTGAWSFAVNINHVTGCINHNPFTARPLAAPFDHADRTYSLVAPANFVFGLGPVPTGPLFAESVRSASLDNVPPFYHCFGEAQVVNFGSLQTQNVNCLCASPTPVVPPAAWHHQTLNGGVSCGPLTVITPFNTVPVPPLLPTGMATMAIGAWVGINPDAFPTGRNISLSYGILNYFDNCLPNDLPIHVFTGVGHVGGSIAILFGSPAITTNIPKFVDLQSMEFVTTTAAGTFGTTPGIGALFLPRRVWSLNPF